MRIQQVTPETLPQLQEIAVQTFVESFADANAAVNMNQNLRGSLSLEKFAAELADSRSEFYLAWFDEQIAGYLKVNIGVTLPDRMAEPVLEIQRIYVLQKFQGKRVGQVLLDKALKIAGERNLPCVWLGVWENNPKAIAFYQKNGFSDFGSQIFMLGDDAQRDILMIREL
ncbi:MAG: GNAT family N-acetyltransferase [Saprospiraceae bacterium]